MTDTKKSTEKVEVGSDTESRKHGAKSDKRQGPSQTNASTSNSSTSSPLPPQNTESVSTPGTSGADTSVSVGVMPAHSDASINTHINRPPAHSITHKSQDK